MKIVVKIGGDIVKGAFPPSLLKDIKKHASSDEMIFVHGGGDVVTDVATKLGKEQRFVVSPDGIKSRYTDRETMDIYTMVMCGMIAKKLVQIFAGEGIRAVSLSGLDASLLRANRKRKLLTVDGRGRKLVIEGGYTGKMVSVDSTVIDALLAKNLTPIVSPVAIGEEGEPLNVDSDRAAAHLAMGVSADTVIFLTDVSGLMLDEKLVPQLGVEEAKAKLHQIGFGMQKKVLAGIEAVEGGVGEAIICSGMRDEPVSEALGHKGCTVITK